MVQILQTDWIDKDTTMGLGCRFYEHRFPEIEDVVMVNVREIQEMGAYVYLSEYNNIEGNRLVYKENY